MQSLKLLWQNFGDAATLSGGSWTIAVSKIQNTDITDVARSNGLSSSNSRFVIDFGSTYATFQALALINLNISVTAQIRIECSNDNTFATVDYDTGYIEVYPSLYSTAETDWKSGNWWWGRNTEDSLSGYIRNFFADLGFRENQYCRVTINDPSNAYGYVDIGRLMVGGMSTFTYNYNWGANLKWNDTSIKSRGLGARIFSDIRPKYRSMNFNLDWLTDSEAYSQVLEIERYSGITGEIFVVPDLDDYQNQFRRSVLCSMKELHGIDKLRVGYQGTTYQFEEIL